MHLALFDLDHTLLDGDSNSLWLHFLADHGLVGREALQRQAEEYARYEAGRLEIEGYLRFQLSLLAERRVDDWLPWRQRFVAEIATPRIADAARAAVARHRAADDRAAIITATHSFLAEGIAESFGLPVLAPQAEVAEHRFTGAVQGEICFAERKCDCLRQWLARDGLHMADFASVHFYSDSINDRPLLEQVSHPVAVNADARLAALAAERGWPCERWRSGR